MDTEEKQRHGGVPLAKGTETNMFAYGNRSGFQPRRCPPREGD